MWKWIYLIHHVPIFDRLVGWFYPRTKNGASWLFSGQETEQNWNPTSPLLKIISLSPGWNEKYFDILFPFSWFTLLLSPFSVKILKLFLEDGNCYSKTSTFFLPPPKLWLPWSWARGGLGSGGQLCWPPSEWCLVPVWSPHPDWPGCVLRIT